MRVFSRQATQRKGAEAPRFHSPTLSFLPWGESPVIVPTRVVLLKLSIRFEKLFRIKNRGEFATCQPGRDRYWVVAFTVWLLD